MNCEEKCRNDINFHGGTQGSLPCCGDLASPYVPELLTLPDRYSHAEALINGTAFPALNLPFHLKVNGTNVVKTPLNELQALELVVTEMGLYLDTHPDDDEAFYVYRQYVELEKNAHAAYAASNGPLFQTESVDSDSYTWIQDPWPWHLKD